LAQDARWPGWEAAHVQADLGDHRGRGHRAEAGDLIEPVNRRGERGDHLLGHRLQIGDVGAEPVDAGQHLAQQRGVVVGEVAGECLLQRRELAA
jgi:hypothetical protein